METLLGKQVSLVTWLALFEPSTLVLYVRVPATAKALDYCDHHIGPVAKSEASDGLDSFFELLMRCLILLGLILIVKVSLQLWSPWLRRLVWNFAIKQFHHGLVNDEVLIATNKVSTDWEDSQRKRSEVCDKRHDWMDLEIPGLDLLALVQNNSIEAVLNNTTLVVIVAVIQPCEPIIFHSRVAFTKQVARVEIDFFFVSSIIATDRHVTR